MAREITSYAEFWPYYLGEHQRPGTRALHYFGTGLGTVVLIVALATQAWWGILVAAALGYGPAWISHATIEKNRPATFTYPVWSLISDYRMVGCWLAGRLGDELKRAGVASGS